MGSDMTTNSFIQTMIDADIDAQSLSNFMFEPAGVMVSLRLSDPIHTLKYYLNMLDDSTNQINAYVAQVETKSQTAISEMDAAKSDYDDVVVVKNTELDDAATTAMDAINAKSTAQQAALDNLASQKSNQINSTASDFIAYADTKSDAVDASTSNTLNSIAATKTDFNTQVAADTQAVAAVKNQAVTGINAVRDSYDSTVLAKINDLNDASSNAISSVNQKADDTETQINQVKNNFETTVSDKEIEVNETQDAFENVVTTKTNSVNSTATSAISDIDDKVVATSSAIDATKNTFNDNVAAKTTDVNNAAATAQTTISDDVDAVNTAASSATNQIDNKVLSTESAIDVTKTEFDNSVADKKSQLDSASVNAKVAINTKVVETQADIDAAKSAYDTVVSTKTTELNSASTDALGSIDTKVTSAVDDIDAAKNEFDAHVVVQTDAVDNAVSTAIDNVNTKADEYVLDVSNVLYSDTDRVGDARKLFTDVLVGEPDALKLSDNVSLVTVPKLGKIAKISSKSGYVATRKATAIYSEHQYKLNVIIQRTNNPADPFNDAIDLGVVWLDHKKQLVISDTLERFDLTTDDGVTNKSYDLTIPSNAVYARAWVKIYGNDSGTAIVKLGIDDITDKSTLTDLVDSVVVDLTNDITETAELTLQSAKNYTDDVSAESSKNLKQYSDFKNVLGAEPLGAKYRQNYTAVATEDGYKLLSVADLKLWLGKTYINFDDAGQLITDARLEQINSQLTLNINADTSSKIAVISQDLLKRTALKQNPKGAKYRKNQNLLATEDGHVVVSSNDNQINIGNTYVNTDDKGQLLTTDALDKQAFYANADTNPAPVLNRTYYPISATKDGYVLTSVRDNKLYLGNTYVNVSDTGRILTENNINATINAKLSASTVSRTSIVGTPCTGLISDVQLKDNLFSYQLSNKDLACKVVGKSDLDWATPHIVDTDTYQVWEADGQSWQVMTYTADDTLFSDTTGATKANLETALTPMVTTLRHHNYAQTATTEGNYDAEFPPISIQKIPTELYRLTPALRYRISIIAAIVYTKFCASLNTNQIPVIMYNVGWPGTESDRFLPQGVSYEWVDDNGTAQTTTAEPHRSAADWTQADPYLWARNLVTRKGVKDLIADKYPSIKNTRWKYLSWVQGPFVEYDNALGFMQAYRAEQNKLDAGLRHILWDQNGGLTKTGYQKPGAQASVDFCQENASGQDWLVGPRYMCELQDEVHLSAMGTLIYSEMTGQCAAYIEKYGTWQPLWITDVVFSADTVAVTTNKPLQSVGDLVVDTDRVPLQPNYGFTLWQKETDTAINITDVSIADNKITLTADQTLSGAIEVGYAVRSDTTNVSGTPEQPQLSATIGNIKMVGIDAPKLISHQYMPRIDAWLCSHRKTYNV